MTEKIRKAFGVVQDLKAEIRSLEMRLGWTKDSLKLARFSLRDSIWEEEEFKKSVAAEIAILSDTPDGIAEPK